MHLLLEDLPVGSSVVAGRSLDEHEPGIGGEAVLARVVGQRDAGVLLDAVELAAEAERGGEGDDAGLPVAQADRSDRRDDGAAGRGHVCQRRRQVAGDDGVIEIGPHAVTIFQSAACHRQRQGRRLADDTSRTREETT